MRSAFPKLIYRGQFWTILDDYRRCEKPFKTKPKTIRRRGIERIHTEPTSKPQNTSAQQNPFSSRYQRHHSTIPSERRFSNRPGGNRQSQKIKNDESGQSKAQQQQYSFQQFTTILWSKPITNSKYKREDHRYLRKNLSPTIRSPNIRSSTTHFIKGTGASRTINRHNAFQRIIVE